MKFLPLIFLLCCQNPNKIQYISHNASVEIVCLNCPDSTNVAPWYPYIPGDSNIDITYNCDSSITISSGGSGKIFVDSCSILQDTLYILNDSEAIYINNHKLDTLHLRGNAHGYSYGDNGTATPALVDGAGILIKGNWDSVIITSTSKEYYDTTVEFLQRRIKELDDSIALIRKQNKWLDSINRSLDTVKWKPYYYKSKK